MISPRDWKTDRPSALTGESRKSPVPIELRDFVTLPENRSAVVAVKGLVRATLLGKRPRVSFLMLHGLPGTGKTRLTGAALGAVAISSPTATGRSLPARELARSDDELG